MSNTSSGTPITATQVNTSPNPIGNYSGSGPMTFAQAQNFWIQAGGNPQASQMAAAVADASSGLDPSITRTNPDGSTSVGLWLIPQNGSPPGSTDPLANARAAVQLSNNGTDWSQWCVAWSDNNCGIDNGTYLGPGSNALGALGTTGTYSIPGAQPTGIGTGASSASATSSGGSSSWTHTAFIILVLLAILLVVFMMVRRKTGSGTGAEGSAWSPEEEAALSSGASDTELAQRLGRSRHAIHVKRSRMGADQDYTH